MTTYLVELYVPRPQAPALDDAAASARAAAEALSEDGTPVSYLESILLPGEETLFCLFAAKSPEAVAAVEERAGLVPTRIVEALTDAQEVAGAVQERDERSAAARE